MGRIFDLFFTEVVRLNFPKKLKRWIIIYGIVLNCNIDLSWFNYFVFCGIEGKGVILLSEEIKSNIKS